MHRQKVVQNNDGMPEGLKCALTTFWHCIRDGYDLLAVQYSSLLRKTGVCQKVLSDNFTGKLINITINNVYILVFYSCTVKFHPCNHLDVKIIHKHGIYSCKTVFLSLL
jgi:hypothetical protein